MRKFAIILGLMLIPLFTKADTTIYGFMNGQFYDVNGNLKYGCLMDGSCYDYTNATMTTLSLILGLNTTTPTTITLSQGLPTPTPTPTPIYVYLPAPTPTPSEALVGGITQPTPTPSSAPTIIFNPINFIGNITSFTTTSSTPVVSNLEIINMYHDPSNISKIDVDFTWQTDKPTRDAIVEQEIGINGSFDGNYIESDAFNDGDRTLHHGTYGWLNPNTTYTFKIRSLDDYGNKGYTSFFTFITNQ